jgi:predicted O-methyltransferase YrrM
VEECFARALRQESKLAPEVLALPGLIGARNRHLYNNLCSRPGTRLLEIGAFKGASTCAFLYENQVEATVIDDWSQFGNHRELCLGNIERFAGRSRVEVLEADCFQVDAAKLGRYDVYLYDGNHGEPFQYRAIVDFYDHLEDEAVLLVDDWNWRRVRDGTRRALRDIDAEILFAREITVPEAPRPADGKLLHDPASWWNGLACFVLRRR